MGKVLYNWYIALVAAGCMMLMGYDSSVYNSVQGSNNWVNYFGKPNAYYIGLVNTLYSVGGIICGWFLAGPLMETVGRRWAMAFGCLVTVVATFIQCFPPRGALSAFIVGRTMIGAGQAFAISAGPVYINEVTRADIRGKVMSFWQMFFSVGSFFAYWVNFACSKNKTKLGEWDWKTVVIFQLMLPIIICAQLPFMPESPRWLIARRGDIEGARNTLLQVRATEEEVEAELLAIREAIAYEQEAAPTAKQQLLSIWKDKSIRKRLGLAFMINVGQQLTGQGTLNVYSSRIYRTVFKSLDTVNLINALNATLGIIFTLNATWTVDRFGRRFLFIVGALGMSMCMMMIAVVGITTPTVDGVKSYSVGVGIATLAFLFAFFFKPTWGACVWIYTGEIFPTLVRATAFSWSIQMQGVSNTIFQQFFPIFFERQNLKAFFFFFAFDIVLAVAAYFLLPETKNVTLEDMDSLFGGVNHVDQGAKILDEPASHVEMSNLSDKQQAQISENTTVTESKKETV